MAFTKITNAGFGLTTGTLVGVAASFSSTVSVGGTLTYEDVTNVDSVGLITARNGIEVTDKGVQVGTGATVDSAAANTLTFLTGGSERLRVDSNGNIGIGTDNPSGILHVKVSDSTTYDASSTGAAQQYGGATLSLQNTDSTANNYCSINFLTRQTATGGSRIVSLNSGNNESTLTFITESSGTPGERLRIDSSGNVGIAIDNPGETLDVGGKIRSHHASDSRFLLRVNSVNKGGFQASTDDGVVIYGASSTNPIRFQTSGSEKARIDTSGRLLLGTTTEGNANADDLTVSSSGHCGVTIRAGTTSSNSNIYFSDGTSGAAEYAGYVQFSHVSDTMKFGIQGNDAVYIDSDRRLLVGTGSAASTITGTNLQSVHDSGSSLALGRNDASVTNGNLIGAVRFLANDPSGYNQVAKIVCDADGAHAADDYPTRLEFHTTSDGASTESERLRIHSAGHGQFYDGAITRVLVAGDVALSGATQTITGIPSWATKITIVFYRASLTGSANFLVRLRAGGSDISTNYVSVSANHTGNTMVDATDGFIIANTASGHKTSGTMVLEKIGTDTKWVSTHMVTQDSGPAPRMGAGDLSNYSGTIDGVKILDTGSNTFDNGTVTIYAEA